MSIERYGVKWNGLHGPICAPLDDGYWTPWHIADAEIARLTARCERLAEEVKAWRKAWCRGDIIMHPDGRKAIDSTIRTSLNHINAAQAAVDQHNDIGGAE